MAERPQTELSDVSETLLIPLYLRAKESQRPIPMIKDDKAVAMVKELDCDLFPAQDAETRRSCGHHADEKV